MTDTTTTETTTDTLTLTMGGSASDAFTEGTLVSTTGEAFGLLQANTKAIRSATTRANTALAAQAKALYFVKSEGLALSLFAPSERGGQGGTAFARYYTEILGLTEALVSGAVAWGKALTLTGDDTLPKGQGKALASVPSDRLAEVYTEAKAFGVNGKATLPTITKARKALGLAPKARKAEASAPKAEPTVEPPKTVGLTEALNLTLVALRDLEGDMTKAEARLWARVKGQARKAEATTTK